MSDGPSDANRAAREIDRLNEAANELADALVDIRDAAFGYSQQTMGIINEALKRAHLKIEPLVQIQIRICGYFENGSPCCEPTTLGHDRCRKHLTRR